MSANQRPVSRSDTTCTIVGRLLHTPGLSIQYQPGVFGFCCVHVNMTGLQKYDECVNG